MQISVSGKNFDVSDALKEYAETRLSKISRYFDHILTANVTLSTERNWHIAEVTVFGKGVDMRGEERSKDMYHSIDAVVEKLERQVKKQKGKVIDRGRHTKSEGGGVAVVEAPTAVREEGGGLRLQPRVDSVKSYVAEPMTLEQAIKEMEELGHEFHPFCNDENGRINVVYKKDRGYGLIDPRLED